MTAHTLKMSPVRDEPRLVESVYRTVTALRADPRFADEALPPDAYLAVVDAIATPPADKRRIETCGQKEPRP